MIIGCSVYTNVEGFEDLPLVKDDLKVAKAGLLRIGIREGDITTLEEPTKDGISQAFRNFKIALTNEC